MSNSQIKCNNHKYRYVCMPSTQTSGHSKAMFPNTVVNIHSVDPLILAIIDVSIMYIFIYMREGEIDGLNNMVKSKNKNKKDITKKLPGRIYEHFYFFYMEKDLASKYQTFIDL
jgi:hypothetical protein